MRKYRMFSILIIFSFFMVLAGCMKGEQTLEEIDPPKDAETVDKQNENNNTKTVNEDGTSKDDVKGEQEMIAQKVYLIDANGMVAPQTIEVSFPESGEVAKQALEYLVKEGPVTPVLPNGFRGVLPEGTEILGLTLQEDGTVVVDLSEEFKNYDAKEERKILEAMTHTLTQFDNIDKVKLWINGKALDEMPVDGTPVSNGYSRANGINITESDANDLLTSETVTLHLPAEYNDTRYYVPITKYVQNKDDDVYEAVVNSLLNGPGYHNNLIHVFNEETRLTEEPELKDGILQLVFNEDILKDQDKAMLSDEVMETLTRSLTELQGIEGVDIKVENKDKLVNENGEKNGNTSNGRSCCK